ncbi:MAG: hypothetical protein PHH01_02050 [Patescibacteria group bacterium]|nr:hypothetical protein [Patescibacteria group bacterium]
MKTNLELIKEYFETDSINGNIALSKAPGIIWSNQGINNALAAFHLAAELVPAYKDFLKVNKVDHHKIKTYNDFKNVPLTDKNSYLLKYPINKLCLEGNVINKNVISSSSGSTGVPFYWPRTFEQDINIARSLETLYINNFSIDKKSTLFLICLGLGVWTAGEMMFSSGKLIAQKGYKITVMCPGIDLKETIKVLKNIAPLYKQTFIIGYPAFVKDIVDESKRVGINIEALSLKVLVGGEVFTEQWREYIYNNAKMKDRYKDITSVLGSSEGGIVGMETPLCVFIREKCYLKILSKQEIFESDHLPSIVQYNPMAKFIETINKEIVLTNAGGLPLVRYNTRDEGGVIEYDNMIAHLEKNNITKDIISKNLSGVSLWTFPFVYLFGRTNIMATLYAVNVYPENIKPALYCEEFSGLLTGRFAMKTSETKESNQYLEIFVELSPGQFPSDNLRTNIENKIINQIKSLNSEFNKMINSVNRKNIIRVNLKEFQNKEYFSSDKQKYVILG